VKRALLFDLGNVLIPFDFKRGYAGIAGLTGLAGEEIRARLARTDYVHRLESGGMNGREFVAALGALCEVELPYARFCEVWSSIFLPETLLPETLLAALAARYRLVLLSNTNDLHFEFLERTYPLLRHFHARVLSHEVKAMKPEAAIYAAAIRAAGCAPEECFYTDDIPEYVAAARGHGIDAEVFAGREATERELRRRGVEW
jgi:putative hydrolase of the HAD superfamily